MHRTWTVVGAVLLLTGAVWVGQGTGILRGSSFMTGDPLWAVLGIAAGVFGAGLIWAGRRERA